MTTLRQIAILLVFTLLCFAAKSQVLPAAYLTDTYIPTLKKKKVALVVNQTSVINQVHLVDSLNRMGIKIQCIFAPEHGFRGNMSAGSTFNNDLDEKTGLRIISLYGSHKKPTKEDLGGVELVVFDIQDVGVRFYTYISTMHYVMEACAENKVPFMVLDRPNPNGHYIDGPILDSTLRSFVGMHPIPIVHGCTVGEIAQMINGEGWLTNKLKCDLTVIKCRNYTHESEYILPVRPSPNLQSQSAIYLYPSIGLLEGTIISLGQGTDKPYQCFGSPATDWGNLTFTPISIKGVAEKPKFMGYPCTGFNLTWYGFNKAREDRQLNLNWLIFNYETSKNKSGFFSSTFFDQLAGTSVLRKQIISGISAEEIRESWQPGLDKYKVMRKKYLLYPETP